MKFKNKISIASIAEMVGGKVSGDENTFLCGINNISEANEGDLTFYSDERYLKFFEESKAGCIFVSEAVNRQPANGQSYIIVEKPYIAFVKVINYLDSLRPRKKSFIHPTAVIDETAVISPSAYIGPFCTIGRNSRIGENSVLLSNVSVYDDVSIGNNCILHSSVSVCCDSVIGNDCLFLPGAVIGSEGFGFIENKDGSYTKIPQIGNVVICDNVEVGANTTIDRAMVGSTVIESGVKLDNLIQIAHNCFIGENTAMAAQVGVSGSTIVGKRVKLGGQVGIAGHLDIADDVVLLAKSGVPSSIKEPGVYIGVPPRKKLEAFRIEGAIHNLPQMFRDLAEIKREILKK